MPTSSTSPQRFRRDRCPGVFRPWPADDGGLVRLRLVGGRLSGESLAALAAVATEYGDGDVHLTRRANLQLRGMPGGDRLPAEVVDAIEATGLLPSRTHELVRNLMVSPQSGLAGGRADLRPVADELDDLICADPALAALPGRFLFVLDDGRGDLVERDTDLGLVALPDHHGQVRIGSLGWGPVVALADAAGVLVEHARRFLDVRGEGADAPWHVDELASSLVSTYDRDHLVPEPSAPLPYGAVDGGTHVPATDGVLGPALLGQLALHESLVVTPWHGVLVPGTTADEEDA